MTQSNPLRCVIIEDVEADVTFIAKKLEAFPQEVKYCGTAASIQAAVMLIVEEKPHFIFLDIQLIDGSGFTVLDKLKRSDVPIPYIIATSAFKDFPYERQNPYVDYFLRYFEKTSFLDSGFAEKLEEAIYAVWVKTREERIAQTPQIAAKKMLSLNMRGGAIQRIDPTQIIYLRVKVRDLILYTTEGNLEFRLSLTRFMIAADLPFLVRINANEAINIDKEFYVQPNWRIKMEGSNSLLQVHERYRQDFLKRLDVVEWHPDHESGPKKAELSPPK